MGVTGKKRSREQSLSVVGAEHSRNAGALPGKQHRSSKAGSAARQNGGAGSSQPEQRRGAHASGHARGGKALNKGQHSAPSAKASQQKQSPLQKAVARPDGGQAAPVISTADATQHTPTSADSALPPRKKRNKNKFKPDPEPDVASAAPQHATADFPSRGTSPAASHHNTTATGRPPQESAIAAGTGKKKWKRKNKSKQTNNNDAVSAPAQSQKVPGAEQPTVTQSNVSQAAAKGKRHGQGVRIAKVALDPLSQAAPAAPAQQEAHRAGANAKRQHNKQLAQQSDARQSGPLEPKPQKKRQKVHGREQTSNGDQAPPALQQAAASKAGAKEAPGAAAAATVAVQTVTAPPLPGTSVSANWAALKAQIAPSGIRRRPLKAAEPQDTAKAPEAIAATQGVTPVLAVDCEMVGAGPEGARSLLARVCVVNQAGNVLLDEYVAQKERVTDYRTRFSGIRPSNLVGAPSLEEVQAKVAAMFKGRIVVGHSITNDLTALLLSHPRKLIRDTARFPPLMRATAPGRRPKPRALRHLAAQHLGLTIQAGEHSPVDDARAALYLYLRFQKEWEHNIERGTISQLLPPLPGQNGKAKRQRTLEEMAAADPMVDL